MKLGHFQHLNQFHLYLQESKSDPETSLEATNIQLLCSRTPVSLLKEHDMFNVLGFSAPGLGIFGQIGAPGIW